MGKWTVHKIGNSNDQYIGIKSSVLGFPGGAVVKNPPPSTGDIGS